MRTEKVITILADKKKRFGERKGPVRPSKKKDPLARRRIHGPFLRVFDIARYADGTDVDYHYAVQPFPNNFFVDTPDTSTFSQNAEWNADLFDTPYETWPDVFREITEEIDAYNIVISGNFVYVENRGLRSSDGVTSIGFSSSDEYFPEWQETKYTATDEYSASPVIFTFDKDCDLFLAPMLHDRVGTAIEDLGSNQRTTNRFTLFKSPLSRVSTLSDATWASIWAQLFDTSGITPSEVAFYRTLLTTTYSPTIYRMTYTGISPPLPHTYTSHSASTYPTAAGGSWIQEPDLTFERAWRWSGHCVGAIRKHLGNDTFEWYFIWADTTWDFAEGDFQQIVV